MCDCKIQVIASGGAQPATKKELKKEIEHFKCARCKCFRLPELFLNDAGRKLKTCEKCRAGLAKARALTKQKKLL
jgi:hypothetical protein